jgi:hypothetical protein
MCKSVVEVVIHQMVQDIAPRCDLPHIRGITLSRFLDRGLLRNTDIYVGDEDVEYLSYCKSVGIHIVLSNTS